MAVVTSPANELPCARIIPFRLLLHRRIRVRPAVGDDLYEQQQDDADDQRNFHRFF
jgi:hypothetical protein